MRAVAVDAGRRLQSPPVEHGEMDALGHLRILVEMTTPAYLGGREPVFPFRPEPPARMVISGEAEVAVRAPETPVGGVPELGHLDPDRDRLSAVEDHLLLSGVAAQAVLLLGR